MFDQYFYSNSYKNNPARNFNFIFKEMSYSVADIVADKTQNKGDDPDEQDRCNNGYIKKGKTYSHNHGIDTCCKGQDH